MRLAVMALIGAAMLPGAAMGQGPHADDRFDVWNGSCTAASYAADAKGHTPYPCNALLHMAMAADPGHEMLVFVIKGDDGKQNGTMLSFGGMIDAQGNLQVARVQFTPGESTTMGAGSVCVITREGEMLKHVVCNASASDGSGRSAAIDFTATSKSELKTDG